MLGQTITLIAGSGKTSRGSIEVETFSLARRLLKTCLRSLIIILCGLCSVLVPILHFILPFIFLGCAIYVAIVTFQEKTFVSSGQGKCPECGLDFRIMKRAYKFPFYDSCEGCRREIRIELRED